MKRILACISVALTACELAYGGWFLPEIDRENVGTLGIGNRGYANEGIASDGTYFYTSRGFAGQDEWLVTYGTNFSPRENQITLDYDSKLHHVGDIAIGDGVVYVPVTDYIPGGEIDYAAIGVYSAGDNTLLEVADLSTELSIIDEGDLAGVEVHGTTLLLLEYQTRGSGINPRIWRANLVQPPLQSTLVSRIEFDSEDFVTITTFNANGAAVYGDYLLVAQSEKPTAELWTNDEYGYIDVYWLNDILNKSSARPIATFTFDVPEIHAEGITIFNNQLWTAQDKLVIRLTMPSISEYYAPDAPLVRHWGNEGKRRSSWFGWMEVFQDTSGLFTNYHENWLYHYEHGWIYVWNNSQDFLIFYDYTQKEYIYTTRSHYPWMYSYEGSGDWRFYFTGGYPGSRWYYSARDNAYLHEDLLLFRKNSVILDNRMYLTTRYTYLPTDDWSAAVKSDLGDDWEVCDWNELVEKFGPDPGKASELSALLGRRPGSFLTRGNIKSDTWGYYSVYGFDGQPWSGFSVQGDIQNLTVVLGHYWDTNSKRILAVRTVPQ